ncbi:involucrin-like [Aphis gossypii]|uniref:involucrin-like n=1 Tax=Aphis gossypii TaxID=80765 RepID=UPI0021590E1C|nr:involucrin-like [Aphis gossypii]
MKRNTCLWVVLTTYLVQQCSCQTQLKSSNVQEDPCKAKNKVVADAAYCDRYWECVDGQPELYDCPNGLVYAGKNRGVTEGCDYPWRADYCEGKTQANGPIAREHCDWLYGIFGHETSCTRYWTCWNSTATEQLCIGGLLYNEKTHSCDWPENVDGCQKHPLCNEDANGNVPLGKSCNRYWQCQGGYPRLQRCPAMLVFDRRTLRCVVPPTEDCEVPTTPAPSPDDLPSNEDDGEENVPQQAKATAAPAPQQQRSQQQQQQQPQQLHQRQGGQPQQRQQFQQQQQQPQQQQLPAATQQQQQQQLPQQQQFQQQQRAQFQPPAARTVQQPQQQQQQQFVPQQRAQPQQFQLPPLPIQQQQQQQQQQHTVQRRENTPVSYGGAEDDVGDDDDNVPVAFSEH